MLSSGYYRQKEKEAGYVSIANLVVRYPRTILRHSSFNATDTSSLQFSDPLLDFGYGS
jgi:hypothetical protein